VLADRKLIETSDLEVYAGPNMQGNNFVGCTPKATRDGSGWFISYSLVSSSFLNPQMHQLKLSNRGSTQLVCCGNPSNYGQGQSCTIPWESREWFY